MTRSRRTQLALLLLLVGGVLAWLVALPNARLILSSVLDPAAGGARWTLDGYRRFFCGDPSLPGVNVELLALRNTLLVAAGSVVLSALIGVPLAFLFHGYEFPGRRLFATLATVPVLLPPLVGVVAFYFLYAESGVVTRWVGGLLRLDEPPWRFRGLGAVLLVHAYSMYVYFYAFVTAGLARLDPAQQEAAATLGAPRWRVLLTITLPLLTPSLVGAALLVFMMSTASFTAPYVLGGIKVLTTQLLISRQFQQPLLMGVEATVLTGSCLAFLALLRWVEGRGRYYGGSKGAGHVRRRVEAGWQSYALGGLGVLFVLLLLLPHLMLVLIAVADNTTWTTQLLPSRYTLEAFGTIATSPTAREPFVNSVAMALTATGANLLWALPAAFLLVRFRFVGRGLLEALAMLPWAVPGTVIALALAEMFSVAAPWQGRWVLIGTWSILPLAYFVRHLPLVLRAVQASLAQVDPVYEEAAASLGAGPVRQMRTVVLPLVLPGAVAGSLLALISALGEFVASVVLYTPHNRPIAMEIWNHLRSSAFGLAAAYGVVLIAVVCLLLLANAWLSRGDSAAPTPLG